MHACTHSCRFPTAICHYSLHLSSFLVLLLFCLYHLRLTGQVSVSFPSITRPRRLFSLSYFVLCLDNLQLTRKKQHWPHTWPGSDPQNAYEPSQRHVLAGEGIAQPVRASGCGDTVASLDLEVRVDRTAIVVPGMPLLPVSDRIPFRVGQGHGTEQKESQKQNKNKAEEKHHHTVPQRQTLTFSPPR